jgi:prenyltransferase beta subunit
LSAKRKEAVERSIASSLEYIFLHQSDDGSWVDCQLPPGWSDAWVTAYVGYKLRHVPGRLRRRTADSTLSASKWLLGNQYPDGGWGYNREAGSDADSTAYAILFLASEGIDVQIRSYKLLMEFQCSDGGFSTYLATGRTDSWRVSHLDVTPVVLQALLTKYVRKTPFIKKGMEYVLKQRTADGLWNSFWWDSFLYGTEVNLSLLDAIGARFDKTKTKESLFRVSPKNAFESALLISCVLFIFTELGEPNVLELVDQLVREQGTDGSWKGVPIIRLTKNGCFEPWTCKDTGTLYPDPKRLITTSTVLESLCKVYAQL